MLCPRTRVTVQNMHVHVHACNAGVEFVRISM